MLYSTSKTRASKSVCPNLDSLKHFIHCQTLTVKQYTYHEKMGEILMCLLFIENYYSLMLYGMYLVLVVKLIEHKNVCDLFSDGSICNVI